jgi:hypothetical protein
LFIKLELIPFIDYNFIANLCKSPQLTFEKRYLIDGPLQVNRSNILSLKTLTNIICDTSSFRKEINWKVNKIDLNSNTKSAIDLTSNPTSKSGELVFEENALEYGLYQIIFGVSVFFNTNDIVSSSMDTYVDIVPTGFVVNAFSDQTTLIEVGRSQEIDFQPGMYSYDLDGMVEPNVMEYKYFCRVVENGVESNNFTTDLMTFKMDSSLIMNNSTDCLDSPGKIV